MGNFIVEIVKDGCLVIAVSHDSPINNLDQVEAAVCGYTGNMIFDLTLINGINRNQYLEAQVTSGTINRKSFRIKKDLDVTMHEIRTRFFQNNPEIVERSVISNALKFLLKTGQCC